MTDLTVRLPVTSETCIELVLVTRLFHSATVSQCDHFLDAACICCLKLNQIFFLGGTTKLQCIYYLVTYTDFQAAKVFRRFKRRSCINCETDRIQINWKNVKETQVQMHVTELVCGPVTSISKQLAHCGLVTPYKSGSKLAQVMACCLMAPNHYLNQCLYMYLTHWGRVTHICVVKLTIIGSDNGLSPGRRQAIIWTNAGILLIGPLGTNFSEI